MRVLAGSHVVIGLAIVVVIIAVASGLILLGPPAEERARRLDARRVEDLRGITRAVDLYWTRHGHLPSSWEELSQDGSSVNFHDPGTGQPYEYRVVDAKAYELCALFQRDSAELARGVTGDFWSHGASRQCFQLKAQEVRR